MNAGIIQQAANLRPGNGEDITLEEVLAVYPQFGTEALPQGYLSMILHSANASIREARWHSQRKLAVCLYVAHFATLYLKSAASADASPAAIARRGDGSGNVSSKSVGGVSVSYGASEGAGDLAGYGGWKETVFGQQLATLARICGAGMMVVR